MNAIGSRDLSPFGEKLGLDDDDNKKPRKDSNTTTVASTSMIPQDQTGLYKRY
jgi:hypothetical protein